MCVSLALWSVLPSFSHTPSLIETVQNHAEMIEDHGHSHGLEEDLIWAIHGHSHDVVDHDHGQAFLFAEYAPVSSFTESDTWRMPPESKGPSRQFPIDRPPRV